MSWLHVINRGKKGGTLRGGTSLYCLRVSSTRLSATRSVSFNSLRPWHCHLQPHHSFHRRAMMMEVLPVDPGREDGSHGLLEPPCCCPRMLCFLAMATASLCPNGSLCVGIEWTNKKQMNDWVRRGEQNAFLSKWESSCKNKLQYTSIDFASREMRFEWMGPMLCCIAIITTTWIGTAAAFPTWSTINGPSHHLDRLAENTHTCTYFKKDCQVEACIQ